MKDIVRAEYGGIPRKIIFSYLLIFITGVFSPLPAEGAITSSLGAGSSGSEVRELQQILSNIGALRSPISGYFDQATLNALLTFQASFDIYPDGVTGMRTRERLNSFISAPYAYAPYYSDPFYQSYPNYSWNSAPNLTSISPNNGSVGQLVTLSGGGFTSHNDIRITGPDGTEGVVKNLNTAANGTLAFLFPRQLNPCEIPDPYYYYSCSAPTRPVVNGNYSVSVANELGRSNKLTYTVTGSPYLNRPVIDSLSPSSGYWGTSVAIYGTGFLYSGNTVEFGGITFSNIYSYDTRSLRFTVPWSYGGQGRYTVAVSNANGRSNTLYFTITP